MLALQGNGHLEAAIVLAVIVMAFGRTILRAMLGLLAVTAVAALGVGVYAIYHAVHHL